MPDIPADALRAAVIAVEEAYAVEFGYRPDAELAERLARSALEAGADARRNEPSTRGGLARHPASYTYDPQTEATYVYLHGPIPPGGVVCTVPLDAMVNLDYGPDGRILGIEILGAWPEAPAVPEEER